MRRPAGDLEIAEERAPAHAQVIRGVEPWRHIAVEKLDEDAQRRPEPDHSQNASSPMTSEECPGDRRIRAGDQHVNADTIEQGEGFELATRGPHAVIERAARRAEDQSKAIDHEADLLGKVPAS